MTETSSPGEPPADLRKEFAHQIRETWATNQRIHELILESLSPEALTSTLSTRGGGRRHVSGPEIMEGVRGLALERFGYLARAVFRDWGVTKTGDFGEIVFNLISVDLLQKTADDRKEDFFGLFDFEEAFDQAFEETLVRVEL